jgi:hypothetical protein
MTPRSINTVHAKAAMTPNGTLTHHDLILLSPPRGIKAVVREARFSRACSKPRSGIIRLSEQDSASVKAGATADKSPLPEGMSLQALGDLPNALATQNTSVMRGAQDISVFRQASPAVVLLKTKKASGSGVILQNGLILTNRHVVEGIGTVRIFLSRPAPFKRRRQRKYDDASMTAQLVTDALVMAIWRRGKPDALLHHSDRGSQYTSEQFQQLIADSGVVCSMSRSGNVWDNAAMESFFSSLKTERTSNKTYRTRNEAKADVFDYIERFYNSKRRHSTIGYLSPMEFERQAGFA